MNRPGQAPQRPPTLPNAQQQMGAGGPFRAPYPQQPQQPYGLPPRGVLQPYPMPGPTQQQQQHRNQPGMVGPPPSFMQSRGGFPGFGGATLHHPQQQQSSVSAPIHGSSHIQQQQQQQQLSSHQQQLSNSSTNQSILASASQANEQALDPNDFPALGSAGPTVSAPTPLSNTPAQSSYASQAGTNLPSASSGTPANANSSSTQLTRDFGPDDFPALGGHTPNTQQSLAGTNQDSNALHSAGPPPGLNGFQQNGDQQHRMGSVQLQHGMIGGQRTHFQSDADKRNYAMKLGPPNHSVSAAWTQQQNTVVSSGAASGFTSQNGSISSLLPTQGQSQSQHVSPGLSAPTFSQSHQQQFQSGSSQQLPSTTSDPQLQPTASAPQTPAQQVLMSAADRWGLLGLLAMIKNADPDTALLNIGTDLGTMGLDMNHSGNLYSTFITPWSDASAVHIVEPDFHIPSCYAVPVPPPSAGKAAAFSDETLFFMFYSSPRDALQEIAAQELFNRNWRFHKDMCIWLTREAGPDSTNLSNANVSGELSTYAYWDPENWEKVKKDMVIDYNDLEDRSSVTSTASFQQQQVSAQGITAQRFPGRA